MHNSVIMYIPHFLVIEKPKTYEQLPRAIKCKRFRHRVIGNSENRHVSKLRSLLIALVRISSLVNRPCLNSNDSLRDTSILTKSVSRLMM